MKHQDGVGDRVHLPVVLTQWFIIPAGADCVDTAVCEYAHLWPIAENAPGRVEYGPVDPMAETGLWH